MIDAIVETYLDHAEEKGQADMASTPAYPAAESLAVELVDDFTELDIASGWGSTYKAATKLDDIGISSPLRAMMPPRANKVLAANYARHKPVGSTDTVKADTIGAFIKLFCRKARVTVPWGFPK